MHTFLVTHREWVEKINTNINDRHRISIIVDLSLSVYQYDWKVLVKSFAIVFSATENAKKIFP